MSTAPTPARVVFVPGMMGSALVDRAVAKDECRRILREGRLAQRLIALLRLISMAPVPPGLVRLDALFARLVCELDPRQLWGANGMVLWALDAQGWEKRLTRGDGYRRGGGLLPGGLFRVALPRLTVDPYDRIQALLREPAGPGRRPLDVMVFPYDWRLDICGNARTLAERIQQRWWPKGVPAQVPEEQRVMIIAHSMGGLLARYYVEYLAGHRTVRHLVTAGTPHRGAPVAYAILTKRRAPFGTLISPGLLDDLLVGLGLPQQTRQVEGITEEILPAEAQFRLFRHCSSGLQLLPSVPFVRNADGSEEPLYRTYAGIRHPPTNHTALNLHACVHHHLVPADRLGPWLDRRGVCYTLIGSDGTATVTGVQRTAPGRTWPFPSSGVTRLVETDGGDGVVPLSSAQLRPQAPHPMLLRLRTFAGVPHQTLFRHDDVLTACRTDIGEHAATTLRPQSIGGGGIPALLRIARTFPEARRKAVVCAVQVRLTTADARERLGVEVVERVVRGRTQRWLARPVPGTLQGPVGQLDYPGVGLRDYVHVAPFGYGTIANVGGILLLPERNEDVIELLTWNVGQRADLFRRETNNHHAERQFTEWFGQHPRLRRPAVAHILMSNTTFSPCTFCCRDLGHFTTYGPAQGVVEARIGWTGLYRSQERPHLDTTRRSLALLGPVWTVEPGSPMPPAAVYGPPAPSQRRMPARTR